MFEASDTLAKDGGGVGAYNYAPNTILIDEINQHK